MKDLIKYIFFEDGHWRTAEIYLLAVLSVFGLTTCFLLPISGGYDEETHLMRVWQMSAYQFLPNDETVGKMPFPAVFWEMSYRRQLIVRAVEPNFWETYHSLSLDAHDYVYSSVETRSVYSPPLLLPQALAMRLLGRSWQWPALTVYYICRMVGLISYILLAWMAVRLIPRGKWVLAILAASPVAILQAATISADTISNGITFLFIGGCLAVADRKQVNWKEWGALVLLLFILFWGKVNVVPLAVLPFMIIRPSQFRFRYGYAILVLVALGLFLVEVVGWSLLAYSSLHTAPDGTDPVGQVRFILTQPPKFIAILGGDIWMKGWDYLLTWLAIYGFAYWPVPGLTYYSYGAGLLASLWIDENAFEKRIRLALLFVFVVSYLITITLLYVSFNPVGHTSIDGVQGRYFTTVMPLLFLAFVGVPFQRKLPVPAKLPVWLVGVSLSLYIGGMYLSYHIPCGSQYYRTDLCYQPNYKNWAPDALYSPPVSGQLSLTQEIIPECNGLTEVRVWIDASGADPMGVMHFNLRNTYLGHDFVSLDVHNSELPAGNWYTLHFQPDWESTGKLYLLTIHGDMQIAQGPKVAYSLKPEYPAGKLFENDVPLDRDLIFQTGCIAGLGKLIHRTDLP